jgi:hypothetical protein
MTGTIEIATVTGAILAIDLGKYKSVACLDRSGGDRPRNPLAVF